MRTYRGPGKPVEMVSPCNVFGSAVGIGVGISHQDVVGLYTGALVRSGVAHALSLVRVSDPRMP